MFIEHFCPVPMGYIPKTWGLISADDDFQSVGFLHLVVGCIVLRLWSYIEGLWYRGL